MTHTMVITALHRKAGQIVCQDQIKGELRLTLSPAIAQFAAHHEEFTDDAAAGASLSGT